MKGNGRQRGVLKALISQKNKECNMFFKDHLGAEEKKPYQKSLGGVGREEGEALPSRWM